MNQEDKTTRVRLKALEQLYSELRAYRTKEFQTFIFAFPIVGAGLLPDLDDNIPIKILLTVFCFIMIFYLWSNHGRMMLIKQEIVNLQELVGLHEGVLGEWEGDFDHLDPYNWIDKTWERHLGTVTYSILLFGEVVFLWFTIVAT